MDDTKEIPEERYDGVTEEQESVAEVDNDDENDLDSRIQFLEEERDTFRELAARAQADLINFRTRTEREVRRIRELAAERSALEMFPVLDNLDRVLQVKEDADVTTVVQGIRMVRKQFVEALAALGVQPIQAVGEAFSPEYHEAIGLVEVCERERDGIVVEEFQTGYILADKVVRPAKVRVGRCTE